MVPFSRTLLSRSNVHLSYSSLEASYLSPLLSSPSTDASRALFLIPGLFPLLSVAVWLIFDEEKPFSQRHDNYLVKLLRGLFMIWGLEESCLITAQPRFRILLWSHRQFLSLWADTILFLIVPAVVISVDVFENSYCAPLFVINT